MDPNVLNFLISFGASVGANISTAAIAAIAQKIFRSRPDIERRLSQPTSSQDFESALGELAGALEVFAGTGAISIDGAFVSALRLAHFDHQNGTVIIGNARVTAPVLLTGGSGSGQTVIGGNTELSSAGTKIQVGQTASIVITGNAGIKQT
ncbi:MAG: hypothetical protein WC889_09550 [Myxococcota bacterium]